MVDVGGLGGALGRAGLGDGAGEVVGALRHGVIELLPRQKQLGDVQ